MKDLITKEVLEAVYQIVIGQGTGTAFEISINSEFYLITAAHCITDKNISIIHDNKVKNLDYLWKKKHQHADIAVIKLKNKIHGSISLENSDGKAYSVSEKIFFLGFPYRLSGSGAEINHGFDLPFIKAGIISAFNKNNENFYIDAHNNPGFSGGPVIQIDKNNKPKVIGIINGFIPENKPIGFENTGICIATQIRLAIEIIEESKIV
jgi:S1-C subfamily serine protease